MMSQGSSKMGHNNREHRDNGNGPQDLPVKHVPGRSIRRPGAAKVRKATPKLVAHAETMTMEALIDATMQAPSNIAHIYEAELVKREES